MDNPNPVESKPRKPRKPSGPRRPRVKDTAPLQPGGLIDVERKDETGLRPLSKWTIYRLAREGVLPHVKVGRRVFLTHEGIAAFLASGGEAQP